MRKHGFFTIKAFLSPSFQFKWVSVKDSLPEENGAVLVAVNYTGPVLGFRAAGVADFYRCPEYGNYDWFIRYRPDFILQDLNIDFNNLNINTIYTTTKMIIIYQTKYLCFQIV